MLAISRRLANLPQWKSIGTTLLVDTIRTMRSIGTFDSNTSLRDVVIPWQESADVSVRKRSLDKVVVHGQCERRAPLWTVDLAGES